MPLQAGVLNSAVGVGDPLTEYTAGPGASDFTIFALGGRYLARNNTTGLIDYFSSDCSAVLNGAAGALPFGVIQFTPGVFPATNVEWKTALTYRGAGVGATILQLPASSPNGGTIFKSTAFDSLTGTTPTVPNDGIYSAVVEQMTLDGNKANQGGATGQTGIKVFGHGCQFRRVEIANFTGNGLQSEWNGNVGPTSGEKTKRHIIDSVTSHDNGGDGFNWSGPTDCKWFGAVAHSNTGNGYNFTSAAGTSGGQQLMGCHAWGTGQPYGYVCDSSFINLIGCQMEIGSTAAVLVRANQISIQGGQVYRNAPGASVYGIVLGDGTHPVSGCNIDTLVQNADAGAVNFANDAGANSINVNAYQTSGTFVVGTPHPTTQSLVNGSGGATIPHNHLDLFNANPAAVPLTVRQAATPTVPHQIWSDSTGARLSAIHKGYFMTRRNSAPAAADVATNEVAYWYDPTAGAAKVMFMAKNASGTVVTGSVALA